MDSWNRIYFLNVLGSWSWSYPYEIISGVGQVMGNITNGIIFIGVFLILMLIFVFLGNVYLGDPTNLFVLFVLVGIMFLFVIMFLAIGSLVIHKN